jgi:hypothetical protein
MDDSGARRDGTIGEKITISAPERARIRLSRDSRKRPGFRAQTPTLPRPCGAAVAADQGGQNGISEPISR